MRLRDEKIHKMFELAMWDEHISAALYSATASRVKEPSTKNKLLYLAEDERRHLEELHEMHGSLCCQVQIDVAKISLPTPEESVFLTNRAPLNMESFLAQAMEKEQNARDFYLEMSNRFPDGGMSSVSLLYISSMEADHYSLLKTELENFRRLHG